VAYETPHHRRRGRKGKRSAARLVCKLDSEQQPARRAFDIAFDPADLPRDKHPRKARQGEVVIEPLFVSVEPHLRLTDHDGVEPVAPITDGERSS